MVNQGNFCVEKSKTKLNVNFLEFGFYTIKKTKCFASIN